MTNSSRQRVPTSGRSNLNDFLNNRAASASTPVRPKTSSFIKESSNMKSSSSTSVLNTSINSSRNPSTNPFLDNTLNHNSTKRPSTSIPRASSTSRLGLDPHHPLNSISNSDALAFSLTSKAQGEYVTESESAFGPRPICHNISVHRPRTDFVSTSSNLQLHSSRLDPSTSLSLTNSAPNYNRTRIQAKARPTTANNPLSYIQTTSPRDYHYESQQLVEPPLLPPSKYTLIPTSYYLHPDQEANHRKNVAPDDNPPGTKYVRPLVCPEDWLAASQKPDLYEKSHFANPNEISKPARTAHCRSFIERNRQDLWKYNIKYKDETPRTICNEIINHPNYLEIMTSYYDKERVLKLSSSKGTRNCLDFESPEDPYIETQPPPYCSTNSIDLLKDMDKNRSKRIMLKSKVNNSTIPADPYMASITTSRTTRESRINSLLSVTKEREIEKYQAKSTPQEGYYIGKYARGFNHAHEYGTFSNFNAILKQNKATIINR